MTLIGVQLQKLLRSRSASAATRGLGERLRVGATSPRLGGEYIPIIWRCVAPLHVWCPLYGRPCCVTALYLLMVLLFVCGLWLCTAVLAGPGPLGGCAGLGYAECSHPTGRGRADALARGSESRQPRPIFWKPPTTGSLCQPVPFLQRCPLPLTSAHCFPKVSDQTSYRPFPLRELILLLSGQCPNPGPQYPCPVCGRPYRRSEYSYLCSLCGSWVHGSCSGVTPGSNLPSGWRCPTCCTPPPHTSSSPDSSVDSMSSSSAEFFTPPSSPTSPLPSNPPHQDALSTVTEGGTILQLNCNGIGNSKHELSALLHSRGILVACIQESKLHPLSPSPDFPNYTVIRRDRPTPTRGGGLLILVHHSIQYKDLPSDDLFANDSVTEHLAITAFINKVPINIFNIYIPPTSSCPANFRPPFDWLAQIQGDSLVLGDFNAHHLSWFSSGSGWASERGEDLFQGIIDSDLTTLNTDTPTRVPSGAVQRPTSPDISMATQHIALDSRWSTLTTLNSDHLPILIQLGGAFASTFPEPPHRTFINFRKANWEAFQGETEREFALLTPPSTCGAGEKAFRFILSEAAKHHIPSGHVPNMIPRLSARAREIIRERDTLRATSRSSHRINVLDERLQRDIDSTNRQTWIEKVESCSHKYNVSQFFGIIRSLNGSRVPPPPNQPITFGSSHLTLNREIACAFNLQFSNVVNHTPDQEWRRVKRRLDTTHPLDTNASPFSPEIVRRAILQSGNSRAAGPDGLTILHLKHLGPRGLAYLTRLYNLSYNNADIPSIWKKAIVIPLPKPGKSPSLGTNYRPISLLCPAAKVLERLLLPELSRLPMAPTQHGFRGRRSTTTALLPLASQVAEAFNQPRPPSRVVTMSIDLSKAFDTISHTKLIAALIDSPLRSNTVRWLSAYLRGRRAICRYNHAESPHRRTRTGVPQGSCLSPVLFNFFVSTYPQSSGITSTSYADDFTDSCSDPDISAAAARLTEHASRVSNWATERGMTLSAPKSTVTLFTSDNRQHEIRPLVTLGGEPLPLEKNPRILGLKLDPAFKFGPLVSDLVTRAAPRTNILKALTGTRWGQQMETIVITYKSLIGSLLTYLAPVWLPHISATNLQRLQVVQNNCLRAATGCVRGTSVHHLHEETKVLPVADHLSLISAQFLASAMQRDHPSHDVASRVPAPGHRSMRETLRSYCADSVEPYLESDVLPRNTFEETKRSLHTDAVERVLGRRPPNRVLGARPPPINSEELSLPRRWRTTLCQLRCGQCPSLNSFQALIGRSTDDTCPDCETEPHTTNHLFNCHENPTPLGVEDLWVRPVQVSEWLATLPCFSHLQPPARPPPEPPPQSNGPP